MNNSKVGIIPIIVGIILIVVGIIIKVPGGVLTTYDLEGESADDYAFDNKYSEIDEYVGGDAYNYIIGANLVASKITAMIISKTIVIISGVLSICFGLTLILLMKQKKVSPQPITDNWKPY